MNSFMSQFNYHKATFFLSLLGFIGSLIFYFSVLREVQGGSIQQRILNEVENVNNRLDTLGAGTRESSEDQLDIVYQYNPNSMFKFCVEGNNVTELKDKLRLICLAFENVVDGDKCIVPPTMVEDARIDEGIKKALLDAGIVTIAELESLNSKTFIALDGLGDAALSEVNAMLLEYGYKVII